MANTTEVQSGSGKEARGTVATRPPYARAIRVAAGASLLLAGLLNGLPQYVTYLLGQPSGAQFSSYIRWAAEHSDVAQAAQYALLASTLFVTLGVLGVAQVCRWRAPVLTAIGTPLAVWGMWGFHNILTVGYLLSIAAPRIVGVEQAGQLGDGLNTDPGSFFVALAPHLIGSFLGTLLLSIAWIRSGFPRTPAILLLAFLVWDFVLAPVGPLEPHLLLVVAWGWMGIYLILMPDAVWRGRHPRPQHVSASGGGFKQS